MNGSKRGSLSGGWLWAAGGAGFGVVATVVSLFSGGLVRATRMAALVPTPAITVIAVPSSTPTSVPATATPTLAPTATPAAAEPSGTVGPIQVGMLVEVYGTDGEGVRIRHGPGLASEVKLLGLDSEVFQVADGPTEMDGFVWWAVQNPYDLTKSGWAVADFLRPLSAP